MANLRKNYKKHAIISGLIMIGAFSMNFVAPDKPLVFVGSFALWWFSYVMLKYHRCPKCKKHLPLFDFKSTHCRYCGCSLDD